MNATGTYERRVRALLLRDLAGAPVVTLLGARQVGKTMLAKELAASIGMRYCTLDDQSVRQRALSAPDALIRDLGERAVIDEVQRAPELMLAIKASVDRDDRPGRYLLTGSHQPSLGAELSDSLGGRARRRVLRPLTLRELRGEAEQHLEWDNLFELGIEDLIQPLRERAQLNGPLPWREVVASGGFPRVLAAGAEHQESVLGDYVSAFVGRDIRELVAVESLERFGAFLRLAAARTGQVLSASALQRDLGAANVTTVRRWLDATYRSFLAETIPAFARNASSRIIHAPKLFFVDSALALAAAHERQPTGFHLETLVAADLFGWRDEAPRRMVYHWSKAREREVDFILEDGGRLAAVEVKATEHADPRDARHLTYFIDNHAECELGLLLTSDSTVRRIGHRVIAAPWWALL